MASPSTPQAHRPSTSNESQQPPAHHAHIDQNNVPIGTSSYQANDNQLAGLVEAATAAAGQDIADWAAAAAAAAAAGHHQLDGYDADIHLSDDTFVDGELGNVGSGRPVRGHSQGAQIGLSRAVSKKRKRGEEALDPALTGAGAGAGAVSGNGGGSRNQQQPMDGSNLDFRGLIPQQSASEARAAGVHSAAALFRQPSSNKKHTRPPISRLFASLELSPENFLHLQAAAKSYMLDENHPERRDCVGQRGRGDSEMVKLRLYNCVKHFLEVEGYGERFFGEHVVNEGMPPRQHVWPRDQHKIISLVIPLLRRMVTNERQRQYAIETRKGGKEERRRRKTDEDLRASQSSAPSPSHKQDQDSASNRGTTPQSRYPPPLPMPPMVTESKSEMGLGLTDMVLEGYPLEWDAVSRAYSVYNQDFQLDNLWSISGLEQPNWWGLFAAVDSHYQVFHQGNPDECKRECEDDYVNHLVGSENVAQLGWRIGSSDNPAARNEFASSITRDVSRIIKTNLAAKRNGQSDTEQSTVSTPQQTVRRQNNHHHDTTPITLRINVVQDGKRVVPKLDVRAEQCPDLGTMRQLILSRFGHQLPVSALNEHSEVDPPRWTVKVWLPEGLTTVNNDGEWTIAQLSAGTVDWMDGDLKVLVDLGAAMPSVSGG